MIEPHDHDGTRSSVANRPSVARVYANPRPDPTRIASPQVNAEYRRATLRDLRPVRPADRRMEPPQGSWNDGPMTERPRISARIGGISESATLAVDAKAKAMKRTACKICYK